MLSPLLHELQLVQVSPSHAAAAAPFVPAESGAAVWGSVPAVASPNQKNACVVPDGRDPSAIAESRDPQGCMLRQLGATNNSWYQTRTKWLREELINYINKKGDQG